MYHVSVLSILAIIFSMFVSIGGPVFLCFYVAKRYRAKLYPAVIGAAAFALFVLILESVFHNVVLGSTGDLITGNIWLYGLYGGLTAGIFEETGRFLAMRFYMKKSMSKGNALMYGVGHGGIEAVLLVGISYISNLVVALMINTTGVDQLLSGLDEATKAESLEQLSALWTIPAYQFFFAGIERISAMLLQLALSYLVYRAVKEKKMSFYGKAIGIHFVVDAATVILSSYLGDSFIGLLVTECVVLAAVLLVCRWAYALFHDEEDTEVVKEPVKVTEEKKTGISAAANAVKRMEKAAKTPAESTSETEEDNGN